MNYSLLITLPKVFINANELKKHDEVELHLEEVGEKVKLTIEPVKKKVVFDGV
ncbi:AbrB/MazE/SpoVT family DNA-binding domain-containing protein [Candidatus Woesearchaeota archaeon]|nr:AbrB/MazE/SpoVT family DNA-binding domain-containing protein [Candidatus Woesearchaeota archaeon]